MNRFAMALAATLTLLAPAAFAHDTVIGDLTIAHPMAFETAITAQTGAGYMVITNTGDTDDRLIAVRGDFPRVEVHEIINTNDVMQMRQLEQGLLIPAGETVTLEPGGYHVMIMGLPAPFQVGDDLPLTLVFETAGEVELLVKVESRTDAVMDQGDDAMEMDHGDDMDTEEASE